MPMVVRELFTRLGVVMDVDALQEWDDRLDKVREKTDGFAKNLKGLAEGATRMGRNLTIGVTLPIAAAGFALTKAASDAEETRAKFATVFSSIGDGAEKVADTMAESFGLSTTESRRLLSGTGDLLVGFGFAEDAALKLSTEVNELAVDLASFTNIEGGARVASEALTKALLGERESVKTLGIAILDADVKAKVQEMRAQGITFETERQAKAYATMAIALEQTKKAQGDFARTQQSLANQTRIMRARLNDMAVEIGTNLIPLATKVVEGLGRWMERFTALSERTQNVILVVGALVAAVGPLLLVVGAVAQAVLAMNTVWIAFAAIKAGLVVPAWLASTAAAIGFNVATGGVVFGIAALVTGLVLLVKNFSKVKSFIVSVKDGFIEFFSALFERFPLLKAMAIAALMPILGPIIAIIKAMKFLKRVLTGRRAFTTDLVSFEANARGGAGRTAALAAGSRSVSQSTSVGEVNVNVQGTTDMGPAQLRRATRRGTEDALARSMRRSELNLSPAG